MAVDLDQIDRLAATVADIYRRAELELVELIATYLAQDLDAPTWAQSRLNATRSLLRAADAVVQRLDDDTDGVFRSAAGQAFRGGSVSALVELAGWVDQALAEATKDALVELPSWGQVEAIAHAVHRDVGQRSSNILRDVVDVFRAVIAAVVASRQGRSQREMAQAAYQRFVDRGITSFVDSTGRRWQLSSYVEMATRTVGQRAAVEAQLDRQTSLGVDLVYISDAPQECRWCRDFESEVLSVTGPTGTITVPHQLTDEPVEVEVIATVPEARARGLWHP